MDPLCKWWLGSVRKVENLAYFMRFAQAELNKAASEMEREGRRAGTTALRTAGQLQKVCRIAVVYRTIPQASQTS